MGKIHTYQNTIEWTGNNGEGTSNYTAYRRDFDWKADGKKSIACSADPAFRGDATKFNPEEMLLAAVSSCHMLWYLHLCADKGIIVHSYTDKVEGKMIEVIGGGGHFTEITLHPEVVIDDADRIAEANSLHDAAREKCFLSNSCNFPIHHVAFCKVS
jgi:organic hydroperoxide reductase OsmC/OhrA